MRRSPPVDLTAVAEAAAASGHPAVRVRALVDTRGSRAGAAGDPPGLQVEAEGLPLRHALEVRRQRPALGR